MSKTTILSKDELEDAIYAYLKQNNRIKDKKVKSLQCTYVISHDYKHITQVEVKIDYEE